MKKSLQLMLLLISSVTLIVGQNYSGGSGIPSDPYLISTKADLKYLSENSGEWVKSFKQTADIIFVSADFQLGGDFYNSGNGFILIGNAAIYFIGTYDGDMHIISNLYISLGSSSHVGFFGHISGANIKNLGLINADISGNSLVGGLVGYSGSSSTISNCYFNGSVTSSNIAGGLVGYNVNGSSINNSFSAGSVSGVPSGSNVGGLVGFSDNGTSISSSYSTASVSGSSSIGGFVGWNAATINNSYSTGSVSGVSSNIGGFLGYNESAINNSYSTGLVSGGSFNVGGFVGYSSLTIGNSFWDTETSGLSNSGGGTGKTTNEMKTNSTFLNAGWSSSIWYRDDSYNNGYPYLSWQNSGGSPLPVELTTFSVSINENRVELNWETVTEINNYGFEIEKQKAESSSQNPDWEKIGFVQGHGNSNSPKHYLFTDNSVNSSKYFYRLKQIDIDGQFEYSDIVEVDLGVPTEFYLSQNYPNPFNPTTQIQYQVPNEGFVYLIVYNSLGEEISKLVNQYQSVGKYSVSLDASNLPSGVYIYKLQTGNFTSAKKMLLTK